MIKKKYFPVLFIFLGFFVLSLIFIAVIFLTNKSDSFRFLLILLSLVTLVSLSLCAFFFTRYTIESISANNLRKENKYNLGEASFFYNMDYFTTGCTQMKKAKRNKKHLQHFIVAFSASERRIVQNSDRNQNVTRLNGDVSKIITQIFFTPKGKYTIKNYEFGFDRGIFYIYAITKNEEQVKSLIALIKTRINKLIETGNYRVFVEPIFGIAKASATSLINEDVDNANIARGVAERKFEGVTSYHESMRKNASDSDIKELLDALKNNEFIVYYQPKYNLAQRKFTSAEALVRWKSPKYGLVPPGRFIALAEMAGLIHEIDTFVFKQVCEDLNDTKRRGRRLLPVSVNFSLYEFFSMQFLDTILNMLHEYDIDPSLIQIEIIESTSQANQFLSISIIKKLQEKGIKILMDDFGVGFSNIGNLRKIPFNVIKIDKSFIDNIDSDNQSEEVVKFLIQLCKVLGMEVVAEGVDNAKQVEILKKYKCDTIQGYYYSKPIPKDEYDEFLRNNKFEVKEKIK